MAQVVLGSINQDTFGDFLDVASSHRLERLEAKCIDYLLANFSKVVQPLSLLLPLCLYHWHPASHLGAIGIPVCRSGRFCACAKVPEQALQRQSATSASVQTLPLHWKRKTHDEILRAISAWTRPHKALLLQAETQATLKRLSPDTLMAVLRSDNLRVPSEMHVFRSVVSWLEADKSRLQQVGLLSFSSNCRGAASWNACTGRA